jgi:hypothetical protein
MRARRPIDKSGFRPYVTRVCRASIRTVLRVTAPLVVLAAPRASRAGDGVVEPAKLTLPSPPRQSFAVWQASRSTGMEVTALWRGSDSAGVCWQPDAWSAMRARFESVLSAPRLLELSTGSADEVFKRGPYLGTELQTSIGERGSTDAESGTSQPDRREDVSIAEGRSPTASGMRF